MAYSTKNVNKNLIIVKYSIYRISVIKHPFFALNAGIIRAKIGIIRARSAYFWSA
jgi:hypothetical protein